MGNTKSIKKIMITIMLLFAIVATSFVFVGCDPNQKNTNSNQQTTQNYTLALNTQNTAYGSVYGAGTYKENEQITIYAVANDGYNFTSWSDGSTDAIRTISINENKNLTANFVAKDKQYCLDEVEIWAESIQDAYDAKQVNLAEFLLYCDDTLIAKFDGVGSYVQRNLNATMLGNSDDENFDITNSSHAFSCFGRRCEQNVFLGTDTITFVPSMTLTGVRSSNNFFQIYGAGISFTINNFLYNTYEVGNHIYGAVESTLYRDAVSNYVVKARFIFKEI